MNALYSQILMVNINLKHMIPFVSFLCFVLFIVIYEETQVFFAKLKDVCVLKPQGCCSTHVTVRLVLKCDLSGV